MEYCLICFGCGMLLLGFANYVLFHEEKDSLSRIDRLLLITVCCLCVIIALHRIIEGIVLLNI